MLIRYVCTEYYFLEKNEAAIQADVDACGLLVDGSESM